MFAKKADGSLTLWVDYCKLNQMTIKNKHLLPCINNLFDQFEGSKYFFKIDLLFSYHQLKSREEDVPKTAFGTQYDHFTFLMMSFGLTNTLATFMDSMNRIFNPYLD